LAVTVALLSIVSLAGLSDESQASSSGQCGDSLNWAVDDENNLVISGTGDMWDYGWYSKASPWTDLSIETAVITKGVTSIGNTAFAECESLSSITIPDTVTSIGKNAFYSCKSLISVDIPSSVTDIGNRVFEGCESLVSVAMPDSLTSIPDWMFYNCESLTDMAIPSSVITIGEYAFKWCSSLKSLEIPDGVVSIGDDAFGECSALMSISIPSSVVSIGDDVFIGCDSLQRFEGTYGGIIDGKMLIRDGELIAYACGSESTYVCVPDSVSSIGPDVFRDCGSLLSVVIPDSVITIGESAFYRCDSLIFVSIPDSVISIGDWAFYSCDSLCSVEIPGSVKSVGEYAFKRCSSLESLEISDGVVSIGYDAFGACTSMVSIVFSDSLISVGEDAFEGLVFYADDAVTVIDQTAENLAGKFFLLTDGKLVETEPLAVGDDFSIGSLTYEVTSLEPNEAIVTGYVGSPTSVVVPETVMFKNSSFAVTVIGKQAFYGCTTLTSADLGSVSKVDVKAFAQCTRIRTVDAGDSLSTISAYAFCKCTRLVDFDLTDSLKTLKVIGSYAFYKDSKLSGIDIPSFVKTVTENAFSPLTFSDENGDALAIEATSLAGYSYINVDGTLVRQPGPEVGKEYTSNGLKYTVTASMPAEVGISGYTGKPTSVTVSGTVNFDGVIYNVTSVMDNAFYRCRTLTSVDLPGIERVGTTAFYGCTKLTSVSISDAITIGVKAFARCTMLSDLETGDSLRTVAAYSFFYCFALESFDGGDGLKTIGSYAFCGNSSLKDVELGPSVRIIGEKAFATCPLGSISFSPVLKSIKSLAFEGLEFQDADGNVLKQTAKVLHGHSYSGTGGVLIERS
jgi:hypothetical protein